MRQFVTAVASAALVVTIAACSDPEATDPSAPSTASPGQTEVAHGPFFPECGGISDATIAQLTETGGLVTTAKNSSGCQWLVNGSITGPHFSFTWFRGSPIGRERTVEERSRTDVQDINIEGYDGFIASNVVPPYGNILCEIGIQFGDDFIEWSVSYNIPADTGIGSTPTIPDSCEVAKELTRQSIVNSK